MPKLNWTLDEILKHHAGPMLNNKMSDNGTLIYKRVGWKARNRSTQSVNQVVALHKRGLWRLQEVKRKIELFKDREIDRLVWLTKIAWHEHTLKEIVDHGKTS